LNFHFLKNKGKNVYLFRPESLPDIRQFFQKKQFTISLRTNLQQDAKTLSLHLYHYCQRIYQSTGSGYYQLTLAQIKQLAQQELQKYRQQIGLTLSVRFEAAGPLMKLSDLLNEFLSFKQENEASRSDNFIKGPAASNLTDKVRPICCLYFCSSCWASCLICASVS
jgi:hypothetical protein